ncbi:ABC transporter ATP-binding protein [Actinomycetospora termitidis]|uniref:Dipeptide/oligopeptide/nickel ABC transporter ATP-binding protein n=1 Tax=Actinomycetospora termitidis TaxID=3053470 RepID=A0ABT7M6E9_9PSEU|nr:dipeptide/oligopeptide/nickel ABC transporter ATP-binding protein [Actinomycetospora sp. Odt1-22]MDL5156011.1 dipeptide/oligopeptide/nickel ABC transporter ATP-binding protein [Actinomycetospora sp. Odt1-22]
MTPVLEAAGLRRTYPVPGPRPWRRSTREAVVDVDLALEPERSLALVGESGAGKSTLLRLLLALEVPDGGSVRFRGAAVTPRDPGRLRHDVGVVVQDAGSSLDPRATVRTSLREPLECLDGWADVDHDARVDELLAAVGLDPEQADRRPHQFSGGQRQRIALARALIANPSVLVVDEPFSAVDPATRAHLVDLLGTLARRSRLQLLLVTHDLGVADRLCDDVVVLAHGRVAEAGPIADVFARPRSTAAQDLLGAVGRLPEVRA